LTGKFDKREFKLKKELVELIDSLGLNERVRFLDTQDDIPQLLGQFNICVLPSLSEGFSNTLLEYMASRKPVIATNIKGNNEIIKNSRNGLLVEAADSVDLGNKLTYLLEHEDVCEQLSNFAYEDVVAQFSIQQMIRSYEETIEALVGNKA